MSVNEIGSNAARDYSTAYGSKAAAAAKKSEAAKEKTAFQTKTDRTAGAYRRAAEKYQRADYASACEEQAQQRETSDSFYTQQVSQADDTAAGDSKTTFPMPSTIRRLEKYTKVIYEHYAKVNEENKKFDNPENHIWDKYNNPKSPYFVKGLTNKERKICEEAEMRVLYGLSAPVDSYDPIIQKTFGGGIMNDEEWNDEVRNSINDSINQLFEENGIVIPEGAELQLRVDPYEYKIHAGGVDEALARRIEEVLNRGNNGKYLYGHLRQCNPANNGFEQPRQYLYDTAYQEKAVMWHFVNDMTGLDMRKLENRDGVIYTPDGQNLWDVVTERYKEKKANGEIDSLPVSSLYKDYQIFVKEGWDNEEERGLAVGYKNGSLYDLDTEYGYGPGQREWLDKAKERHQQFWENYRKEREETLRTEKDTPVAYTKWLAEQARTEQTLSELGNSNYGKKGTLLTQPDLTAMQLLIDYAVRNGRVLPLTNEILHLPRIEIMQSGLDIKA